MPVICDKCGYPEAYHPIIDGALYCIIKPPVAEVDTNKLGFTIDYTGTDGLATTFTMGYDLYKLGQRIDRIVRNGATRLRVVLKRV